VAYVRTVKTSSGATVVQIVYSTRHGSRKIEHLGSGHTKQEVEALKIAAAQRLAGGQDELDLGIEIPAEVATAEPLPIFSRGWGTCGCAEPRLRRARVRLGRRRRWGVPAARAGPDYRADQQARQPQGARRSRDPAGLVPDDEPTTSGLCPRHMAPRAGRRVRGLCCFGPASLVLYDVTTLYFETDAGDGFREPGFSKERRLEPQITVGLLTDATGFPLMIEAFEGNKDWRKTHPDGDTAVPEDQQVFTAPGRDRGKQGRGATGQGHLLPVPRRRARRTQRGIDEQVSKGRRPTHRDRPRPAPTRAPRRPGANQLTSVRYALAWQKSGRAFGQVCPQGNRGLHIVLSYGLHSANLETGVGAKPPQQTRGQPCQVPAEGIRPPL
jgi:hypothetical protein